MKLQQIIGILLIVVTWVVAGLSAVGVMPYFRDWTWQQGLVGTVILTIVGVVLCFVEYEGEKNNDKKEE